MLYQTLYARNTNESIQTWQIEVDGDKYRTIAGKLNSPNMITSEWTYTTIKNAGKKNELSAEEQAISEADAKYKKKLKQGYFENLEEIDVEKFFQPMLALEFKNYIDKIKWSEGVAVQIKYNGGRVVIKKDGAFTRTGERYMTIPHITEGLVPFFDKTPDAILDGEGFRYELRQKLNKIMELLRKTVHITEQDLEDSKELIRFYIYDGFGFGAEETDDYLKRKAAIDKEFKDNPLYKDIYGHVPTWIVYSKEELDTLYTEFLDDNQEGAILRIIKVPYQRKRTKYLLKYKPVDDAEFLILDVLEGEGNRSGMAGKIICQMDDGRTFKASMKGKTEQFEEVLRNKSFYIGKVVTIYYNGLTGKGEGKPNYARFDCDNWNKGK